MNSITTVSDWIEQMSPSASVIISIAAMLLFGFLMTRITKLLRLPNVTAYILTGMAGRCPGRQYVPWYDDGSRFGRRRPLHR